MTICIEQPCRVKLRCGGEIAVYLRDQTVYGEGITGGSWWSLKGRWLADGAPDSPFDIVAVLEPIPFSEPTTTSK